MFLEKSIKHSFSPLLISIDLDEEQVLKLTAKMHSMDEGRQTSIPTRYLQICAQD